VTAQSLRVTGSVTGTVVDSERINPLENFISLTELQALERLVRCHYANTGPNSIRSVRPSGGVMGMNIGKNPYYCATVV
jgi:hypothetical protein